MFRYQTLFPFASQLSMTAMTLWLKSSKYGLKEPLTTKTAAKRCFWLIPLSYSKSLKMLFRLS